MDPSSPSSLSSLPHFASNVHNHLSFFHHPQRHTPSLNTYISLPHNSNLISKMKLKSTGVIPASLTIMKKQRTNRRRQVRSQISPVLLFSLPGKDNRDGPQVSCDSTSSLTVESSAAKKRKLPETTVPEAPPFRRLTRSYYKQIQKEMETKVNEGVEVSESSSSCVVEPKFKSIVADQTQVNEPSVSFTTKSEVTENDVASAVESFFSHHYQTDEPSRNCSRAEQLEATENEAVSVVRGGVDDEDLACTEQLSLNDFASDYSSSHEASFSVLQSELFGEDSYSSELFSGLSDYTPSMFLEDSGSQFSEKSSCDDSSPSETHALLLQFKQQFTRSTSTLLTAKSSFAQTPENSTFARFEDEEDEESYQRLRERERRQVYLNDYADFYSATTKYGDLIRQQRSQLVHWIVEQSVAKKCQQETVFLGVSLLDRFLSKGFFKSKRNLQIVGIACLTLAIRIEENQPYNIVRQTAFHLGKNVYSRCEVVAMEWLVQEVLNFQCFLPTIYNFMWFYLKAARADAFLEKRVKYLAMLALSDHEQLGHWPSTVAAGLVILASLESDRIESYERVIEVHARTENNDLEECVRGLEYYLQYMS